MRFDSDSICCPGRAVRGVQEGWFPKIAAPDVPSETIYGTCEEIKANTTDSKEIIHSYPFGDPAYWRGPLVNQSDTIKNPHPEKTRVRPQHHLSSSGSQLAMVVAACLLFVSLRTYHRRRSTLKKWEYTEI